MISYTNFEKSLDHLIRQFHNCSSASSRSELQDIDREAIAESTVQRFKRCYDCTWKLLKRYLIEQQGLPDVPNSPKPIFKLAANNNLLPGSLEHWILYANARTSTAHDYSLEKLNAVLAVVPDFIQHAKILYEILSGHPWKD